MADRLLQEGDADWKVGQAWTDCIHPERLPQSVEFRRVLAATSGFDFCHFGVPGIGAMA